MNSFKFLAEDNGKCATLTACDVKRKISLKLCKESIMCCDKSLFVCHSNGKHNKKARIQPESVSNGTTLHNVTKDDRKKSDKNKKESEKSSTSEVYSKVPKLNVVPYELFRPTKKIVGE
jgi:hypothetical protein